MGSQSMYHIRIHISVTFKRFYGSPEEWEDWGKGVVVDMQTIRFCFYSFICYVFDL